MPGAADLGFTTAMLVEFGRAFGRFMDQGWKPRRTM